jgi:hypothetical protein
MAYMFQRRLMVSVAPFFGLIGVALLSLSVRTHDERTRDSALAVGRALYERAGTEMTSGAIVRLEERCIAGVDTAVVALAEERGVPFARGVVNPASLARLASEAALLNRELAAGTGAAFAQRMGLSRGPNGEVAPVGSSSLACRAHGATGGAK